MQENDNSTGESQSTTDRNLRYCTRCERSTVHIADEWEGIPVPHRLVCSVCGKVKVLVGGHVKPYTGETV